jgi:hypothetical protein
MLGGSVMALRNEDLPPHLRRPPAQRPQISVDVPQEGPVPQGRTTHMPQSEMPPPSDPSSDPYLRRNAGIASPRPYERN